MIFWEKTIATRETSKLDGSSEYVFSTQDGRTVRIYQERIPDWNEAVCRATDVADSDWVFYKYRTRTWDRRFIKKCPALYKGNFLLWSKATIYYDPYDPSQYKLAQRLQDIFWQYVGMFPLAIILAVAIIRRTA